MKARGVVGRRIVRVDHERVATDWRTLTVVRHLVLDDGSVLVPWAYETEAEPVGDIQHVRPKP